MRWLRLLLAVALGWLALGGVALAQETARTQDVIYGRKHGLALTMDVFTPTKANGKGVIFVVSGGWFSSTEAINPLLVGPLVKRGYTVFAVVHGSQPKYTVPEIVDDMNRAVRFIRFHAKKFHVDPNHLGIYGGSAGGHLSLMLGLGGKTGDPKAKDPIDRLSSRVQAVACLFPPTDFLNFGKPGNELIDRALQPPFTAAVDFHEFDSKKALYIPIKDHDRLRAIMKEISPITHASAEAPPTLLIHGDKDNLVPLQQSQLMYDKLKSLGVPSELIVRKGAGHGGLAFLKDLDLFADWFDRYLLKKMVEAEASGKK